MLEQVRTAIHQAIPEAEEAISYQIAAFKLRGRVSCCISPAGRTTTPCIRPAMRWSRSSVTRSASHRVSKGTIRFSLTEPVPVQLIKRIAKFKAKEAAARTLGKFGEYALPVVHHLVAAMALVVDDDELAARPRTVQSPGRVERAAEVEPAVDEPSGDAGESMSIGTSSSSASHELLRQQCVT